MLVKITDSSGAQKDLTSTVTVVRAGSSQFLDQVDLSGASAKREGQDVVLAGVRVRDKASQQVSAITARLRWFRNIQGLGLVETSTTGAATLQVRQSRAQTAAEGAQVSPIKAARESPSNGQTVAGIAVIRGWAFSSAGRTIRNIQLLVDGNPFAVVPCCSVRGDVAAGFPNVPQALSSGFGITVNYGGLATGVHTLALKIEDSAGATKTLYKGVLAKRQGGIAFVDQLDLSTANVRIANGALVIEGAKIAGTSRIQRYRFDVSAQAFLLTDENAAEVAITNTSCEVNGNTSSLTALQQNPGADGISLPEALQAINNTPTTIDVLVTWQVKGMYACSTPDKLANLTRGNMTLDGDVDGDGVADVTLDGSGVNGSPVTLSINVSNTTVRRFLVIGNSSNIPVTIIAHSSKTLGHVALVGIEVTGAAQESFSGIGLSVNPGTQKASLHDVLVTSSKSNRSISVLAFGAQPGVAPGEIQRVTIVENEVAAPEGGIIVTPVNIDESSISQVVVANNTILLARYGIIFQGAAGAGNARRNTVEGVINGNSIRNTKAGGVLTTAGNTTRGEAKSNTLIVDIQENQIAAETSRNEAIGILGGFGTTAEGTSVTTRNTVTVAVEGNDIRDASGNGMSISGSTGAVGPTTQNFATTVIQGNVISNSKQAAILAAGGWSASDSTAEVMIANNTVTNSGNSDILISGGTARDLGNNNQGASSNTAMGTVQGNTVQGSTFSDIAVFGGFDDSKGTVTGNLAEQKIGTNNARSTTCQDGLPGNIARCTFANASTEAATTEPREARASTVVPEAMPLLQQFDERISDLRTRAKEATTPESAAELLRLADRLAERRMGIIQRRQQVN